MSEEQSTEDTLAEYGYGSSGVGRKASIVILSLLFVGAAVAAIWMGRLWSQAQSDSLTMKQQLTDFTSRVSELENKNAELSSLLADKQAEMERLRDEWATQVETLSDQHTEQLQRTYAQMNEIVYDSRKTLSYIGDIETRLRDGQNLDTKEAAELQSVVNGLVFLHEQYKKPLNEFRELNRYFNQQLAAIPVGQGDPIETTPLGKRIFQNKKFKEERNQYFENQGKLSALTEARNRVSEAYSSAQRQMAGVSLDINQYLSQLESLVESNERSAADVESFFEKSKEILKIHDKIMSIDPPKTETVRP
ncbi:MAG: hypothetical protein AAF357_08490 [Verrucomicrobiota bacterium]